MKMNDKNTNVQGKTMTIYSRLNIVITHFNCYFKLNFTHKVEIYTYMYLRFSCVNALFFASMKFKKHKEKNNKISFVKMFIQKLAYNISQKKKNIPVSYFKRRMQFQNVDLNLDNYNLVIYWHRRSRGNPLNFNCEYNEEYKHEHVNLRRQTIFFSNILWFKIHPRVSNIMRLTTINVLNIYTFQS